MYSLATQTTYKECKADRATKLRVAKSEILKFQGNTDWWVCLSRARFDKANAADWMTQGTGDCDTATTEYTVHN